MNGTSEEHPLECDITMGEEEAQGLSSLELPRIERLFQVEGEGTMWYHTKDSIDEAGNAWWGDLYQLPNSDLKVILKYLQNNSR